MSRRGRLPRLRGAPTHSLPAPATHALQVYENEAAFRSHQKQPTTAALGSSGLVTKLDVIFGDVRPAESVSPTRSRALAQSIEPSKL